MSSQQSGSYSLKKEDLNKAKQYVQKRWFPIVSESVSEIQKNFKSQVYHKNRGRLINDLKSDLGFYSYFLSKLGEVAEDGDWGKLPSEIIRTIEINRLAAILETSPSEISAHQFSNASDLQKLRLNSSIISTVTTETLADKTGCDQELAFIVALLRNLGLNLIAWNYPRIYQRAISSLNVDNSDLNGLLSDILGYSPLTLGYQAGLGWSSNKDIRFAAGVGSYPDENSGDAGSAKTIRKFCEIGESLACVNDSETFPGASKVVATVQKEITQYLGESGFQLLKARFEEQSKNYRVLSEALEKPDADLEQKLAAAQTNYSRGRFTKNVFVQRCSPEIQEGFTKVYQYLEAGRVSVKALNVLVGELIPHLGFLNGCLYIVNHGQSISAPVLRIGSKSLNQFKPIPLHSKSGRVHPVTTAVYHPEPMIYERILVDGEYASLVVGSIKARRHTLVLSLNMCSVLEGLERNRIRLTFNAILGCLLDCLDRADN